MNYLEDSPQIPSGSTYALLDASFLLKLSHPSTASGQVSTKERQGAEITRKAHTSGSCRGRQAVKTCPLWGMGSGQGQGQGQGQAWEWGSWRSVSPLGLLEVRASTVAPVKSHPRQSPPSSFLPSNFPHVCPSPRGPYLCPNMSVKRIQSRPPSKPLPFNWPAPHRR